MWQQSQRPPEYQARECTERRVSLIFSASKISVFFVNFRIFVIFVTIKNLIFSLINILSWLFILS